ncbi:MSH4-like protein, partial [Mya arenaria]
GSVSTLDRRARYSTGPYSSLSSGGCSSSFSATPSSNRTPRVSSSSRTFGSRRTPHTGGSTIVEGRGLARGEVGMASLDLKKPELWLSQFSDMPTYVKTITKLQIAHPLEVLYSNGCGLLTVKQLCVPEYSSVELEVASKYYCLAAAAALVKYIEFIQNTVFAPSSVKIIFKGSENTTMIDMSTARNLELLQNQRDPRNPDTITLRQDVVSELIEKSEVFYNLQAVISRFLDVDHLLSLCVQVPKQENIKTAENKITNVMYLKHTLELVPPLRDALGDCENPLFKASYKLLEDPRFTVMLNKINCIVHEDARYQKGALIMRSQKCFAVKPNINGLLDIARKTYTEIIDDITDLVQQMSGTYNLPLKVAYSSSRGFHIQMYTGGPDGHTQDSLPGIFIKVTKIKNTFNFTTTDLFYLAFSFLSSVMTELLNGVRDDIGCLYKLTDTVAMLDMLLSFAHACTLSDFVRPEFTDTLAVNQGRHPILGRISVETPVPNNIYASEDSNFLVITGPNMSGKSTYLRQIALLQIMAQMGSFVPADYASFRIANQIFSRIGSDDDLETNSSTFMMEEPVWRKEWGFASPFAFTFFVTHFPELTTLDSLYPNVENYFFEIQRSFSTEANSDKVIYTHILAKGKTQEKHYGIQLAEISTLPQSVIKEAKQLALKLAEEKKNNERNDKELCRQRAVFKLANRLVQAARSSQLDEDSLRQYVTSLRKKYLDEMGNIEE